MSTGHARLSPSNLRWPYCPGSIREEEPYPDVAGEAAIDGTGSHLLLEMCLDNGAQADAYLGDLIGVNHEDKPQGWLVAQDRVDRVNVCLAYVDRRIDELTEQYPYGNVSVQSESKSDAGAKYGRDDWKGTCDITITVTHKNASDLLIFLEIIDYKDGRGWVHVKHNTQLIAYAGGKLNDNKLETLFDESRVRLDTPVRMGIVQPKTSPPIRYEDQISGDVQMQLDRLNECAKRTDDPDAPLIAGKHCQWCKHKPNCTAEAEKSTEVMMTMSEEVTATNGVSLFELMNDVIKDIKSISSEKLAELADARPGIEAIFDRVDEELFARLEAGDELTIAAGYALKPGRSSRAWSLSDEEMVEVLKARRLKQADIFPPKLASPAQIMKSEGLSDTQKERLSKEYIIDKPGKLKLTRVKSAQPAATVESLFSDVEKETQKEVAQSTTIDLPSFL